MDKINDANFRTFAYEVLHSSFGVCEISPDDIHAIGLRLGLLFEDEANESDCEACPEIEPGDVIYRIHADVTPGPKCVNPIGDLPPIPEV